MTKKFPAGQTPTTHFEQIPLSAIETLARDAVVQAQTRPDDVAGKRARRKTGAPPPYHAVQFYESPDALCRIVASFIGEGLEQEAAALLIVTPDHAKRIEACLRHTAFDVDALTRAGRLSVIDARDTLNQFMLNGIPNPSAFRRTVGGLLGELRRSSNDRPIRAYGEMVDLLWKDGREAAAIRVETFWNQLAKNYDFGLLCGYAMGNFYKDSTLDEIKRQHTHLVPTDGGAAVRTLASPAAAPA